MTTSTKQLVYDEPRLLEDAYSSRLKVAEAKVEEALRRSTSMFKTAFGYAAVGASIVDLQGTFLAVNGAFCKIVGYTEEELLTLTILSIAVADDVAKVRNVFERFLASGQPGHVFERRYRHKDGHIIWVQNSVSLIHDKSSNPEFVLALTEDITEHKEAQRAQQIAEEHTASLLNLGSALGEAITCADVITVILSSALSILKSDSGMVALLHADCSTIKIAHNRGIPQTIIDRWNSISIADPAPISYALYHRKLLISSESEARGEQDDNIHALFESADHVQLCLPMLIGDRTIGCLVVFCSADRCKNVEQKVFLWAVAGQCAQAIERARLYDEARREVEDRLRAEEAKRESEAKFFTVVDASSVACMLCDDGRITFINSQFTRTFGYTLDEIPTMETWWSHAYPDPVYRQWVAAQSTRHREHAFNNSTSPDAVEITIRCKDGSSRTVIGGTRSLGAAFPLLFVITFSDITDRKLIEEEREQLLIEAQQRADLDPLTGLYNHRAFFNRLDVEEARSKREAKNIAIVMLDLDNFKFFNDFYGHATGDEVLQKVARKLQSISRRYDTIARFGGDEFAVLLPGIQESDAAIIETRLRKSLRGLFYYVAEQNVTIPISVSLGAAIFTQNDTNCRQVLQRADDRLRWSKTGGELEDAAHHIRADAKNRVQGFSMLDALVAAVDNKDRYTRRHSEDVMEYSLMIYHEMGMDKQAQQTVAIAALLHDVGKIGVPDAILRKPGRLSTEEYEAVKQHPQMGAVMAGAVPGLEETLDAIRHHHERWDGGGYPLGLNGEDIPFIARAMAVADAFSAMTTDRPYRKGMDKRKALEILIAGAGTQWDPKCVTTFINAWSRRHPKARAA